MVLHFVLFAESTDMVCYVGPAPQAICFRALDEQLLLVGAPFRIEYGEAVLLYNSVGVCRGIVGVACYSFGETGDAQVEIATCWIGTSNANLVMSDGLGTRLERCAYS